VPGLIGLPDVAGCDDVLNVLGAVEVVLDLREDSTHAERVDDGLSLCGALRLCRMGGERAGMWVTRPDISGRWRNWRKGTRKLYWIAWDSGEFWLWDMDKAESIASYNCHGSAVTAVAFHPEGELFVTAGDDRTKVRTRLIELFELFDPADPEVIAGRRNLANALY